MEALVTVKGMQHRYGCSGKTARKYIRQFSCYYESPLTAPRWALDEWERNREHGNEQERQNGTGRVIVPRKR